MVQLTGREHVVLQGATRLPLTTEGAATAPAESGGQPHMDQNGVGIMPTAPLAPAMPGGTTV